MNIYEIFADAIRSGLLELGAKGFTIFWNKIYTTAVLQHTKPPLKLKNAKTLLGSPTHTAAKATITHDNGFGTSLYGINYNNPPTWTLSLTYDAWDSHHANPDQTPVKLTFDIYTVNTDELIKIITTHLTNPNRTTYPSLHPPRT